MAILGIDEVGRGPWAGPLVVGACVLGDTKIEGLTDSKKLSAKKREALDPIIREKASYGLGWISAEELDKIGLIASLRKATREAVSQIKTPFHEIIIDGTINFLSDTKLSPFVQTIPKADFLVPEVSAASIIAKVARDNYMIELAKKYPGYGFEKHVGYGTAAHKKALEELGICDEHRKSFKPIATMLGQQSGKDSSKSSGALAEDSASDYLLKQSHEIIARNWKTKFCEIDIISSFEGKLYFTEVKYRKSGHSIEAITPKKLQQMTFAAELFLAKNPSELQPVLAAINIDGDFNNITFRALS